MKINIKTLLQSNLFGIILLPIVLFLITTFLGNIFDQFFSNYYGIGRLGWAIVFFIMFYLVFQSDFSHQLSVEANKKSLILLLPCLLSIIFNFIFKENNYSIIDAFIFAFTSSIYEEIIFRIIPIKNYMKIIKGNSYILVISYYSFIFALLHFTNSFDNILMVLIQMLYAFGLGLLFSSIYLYTRNYLMIIFCHFLINFTSFYAFGVNNEMIFTYSKMIILITIGVIYIISGYLYLFSLKNKYLDNWKE